MCGSDTDCIKWRDNFFPSHSVHFGSEIWIGGGEWHLLVKYWCQWKCEPIWMSLTFSSTWNDWQWNKKGERAEKCKHYNTISPNLLLFTAERGARDVTAAAAALILHRSLSAFDSAQSIMFEKHSGSLLSLQGDITGFSDKPLTEFCIQPKFMSV